MKVTLVALFILAIQTRAFLQPTGTQSRTRAALLSSCRFHDVLCESRRQIMGSWLATSFLMLPTMVQAKVRLWLFNCFFFVLISHVWFCLLHPFIQLLLFGAFLSHDPLFTQDLKEEYRQGTAALSEMDSDAPVPREAYKKLDSGVIYADLRMGSSGDECKLGSRVNLQWVLRKSNGYFVDSSERNDSVPFIFTVGDGNAIQGVDEGIRGMKVGGVRRLLIPPSLAYVDGLDDGKPGPMPVGFGPRQQMRRVQNVRKDVPGEYVYLEVQLTRMR